MDGPTRNAAWLAAKKAAGNKRRVTCPMSDGDVTKAISEAAAQTSKHMHVFSVHVCVVGCVLACRHALNLGLRHRSSEESEASSRGDCLGEV